MRILFLTEVNLDVSSSVLTKMNIQIEEWTKTGHEVFVASLPTINVNNKNILLTKKASGFFLYKSFIAKKLFKNAVFNFGNKVLSLKKYKNYIKDISPDVIYLREMVGFPGLSHLFGKNKIVLESNTRLMDELILSSKTLYLLAKIYQKGINRKISGFIGVTNEVTNQFKIYGKPSVTITNGIQIVPRNIITPHNERIQAVMVCTPGNSWQGLDKYIKMAKLLPGIDFHLAGPDQKNFDIHLKNLFFHGYLNKSELINLYSQMDIGIGTLALHRKNMEEACTLKVREYASFGLPIILAYHDTDFSDKNFDFVLQIENSENNIEKSISEIEEFVKNWKGKRVPIEKVAPLISLEYKEEMRLNFFKEIIGNDKEKIL